MRRLPLLCTMAMGLACTCAHAGQRSDKIPQVGVLTPAENPTTSSLETVSPGLGQARLCRRP